MKKIYTFLKSRAFFTLSLFALLSSGSGWGQSVCGPVAQNFDNTSGSTAGFTGSFSYGTDGSNGFLVRGKVLPGLDYSVTTPTYQLPASGTDIGYGFTLGGTERVARVEVRILFFSTITQEVETYFVGQFVPSYDPATGIAVICSAISTSSFPGIPQGGKYRLQINLVPNTGSGSVSNTITFDDYRTNGTFSQTPLPVNFIGFSAKKIGGTVQLNWKIAGEENVDHYEVERSDDGRNFTSIASVARTGNDSYAYTDANSSNTAYYRIRNVDKDGKFKYSSIARIVNGRSGIVIKAFPQPVTNQLTVQHPTIDSKALLTVSTADGRVVRSLVPATGSMQTYVDVSSLQRGLYMVRFDSGDGSVETMKVIKQ